MARDNWGYQDLAANDYVAAVELVRTEFRGIQSGNDSRETSQRETTLQRETLPVHLMCHSMGGQIASVYLARPEENVDGVIGIGSGTPHYKNLTGKEYRKLRFSTH